MSDALVVGGGLSGLCAAFVLQRQGFRVRVVEKEREVGGLLKSVQLNEGRTFDFGTHFIARVGNSLDEDLFNPLLPAHHISQLQGGNFFGGHLNEDSPCLDLNRLPKELRDRIVVEMLSSEYSEDRESLSDFYGKNYSETLEREVVAPVLKKFLPCPLSDLECGGARPLLHPRFIALEQKATARVKSVPEYDRLFAWNKPMGHSDVYYPKEGGIGTYVKDLTSRLCARGVEISTGLSVDALETEGDRIMSATLSNEEKSPCDLLVWTLPCPLFLRMAGMPSAQVRPTLLPTTLLHLEVSKPFETHLHYLYCYDQDRHVSPELSLFRITFYPNFRKDGRNLCTLELFGNGVACPDLVERAHLELKHLGVISADSKVVFSHGPTVFPGFPIWNRELGIATSNDVEAIGGMFTNVRLLAKARGKAFFTTEIIQECQDVLC